MKLAVVGGRDFTNYSLMKEVLDHIQDITVIVSGGALGADSLARRYAQERNLPIKEFIPDWTKDGKFAGLKRNILIVNECDQLIAFWDTKSKGTKHSIDLAEKQNKFYGFIQYDSTNAHE